MNESTTASHNELQHTGFISIVKHVGIAIYVSPGSFHVDRRPTNQPIVWRHFLFCWSPAAFLPSLDPTDGPHPYCAHTRTYGQSRWPVFALPFFGCLSYRQTHSDSLGTRLMLPMLPRRRCAESNRRASGRVAIVLARVSRRFDCETWHSLTMLSHIGSLL